MMSGRLQDCHQPVATALTRHRRGADQTDEATLTTSDDKRRTTTFRDTNATLTVWYPSELLDRNYRLSEILHSSCRLHIFSLLVLATEKSVA